jgi:hypothetical protein
MRICMRGAMTWAAALAGICLGCGGGSNHAESSAGATSSGAIEDSTSVISSTTGVDGSTASEGGS